MHVNSTRSWLSTQLNLKLDNHISDLTPKQHVVIMSNLRSNTSWKKNNKIRSTLHLDPRAKPQPKLKDLRRRKHLDEKQIDCAHSRKRRKSPVRSSPDPSHISVSLSTNQPAPTKKKRRVLGPRCTSWIYFCINRTGECAEIPIRGELLCRDEMRVHSVCCGKRCDRWQTVKIRDEDEHTHSPIQMLLHPVELALRSGRKDAHGSRFVDGNVRAVLVLFASALCRSNFMSVYGCVCVFI